MFSDFEILSALPVNGAAVSTGKMGHSAERRTLSGIAASPTELPSRLVDASLIVKRSESHLGGARLLTVRPTRSGHGGELDVGANSEPAADPRAC